MLEIIIMGGSNSSVVVLVVVVRIIIIIILDRVFGPGLEIVRLVGPTTAAER